MLQQVNSVVIEITLTKDPEFYDTGNGTGLYRFDGTNTMEFKGATIPITVAYSGKMSQNQVNLLKPGRVVSFQNANLGVNKSGELIILASTMHIGFMDKEVAKENKEPKVSDQVPIPKSVGETEEYRKLREYSDQDEEDVPLFT